MSSADELRADLEARTDRSRFEELSPFRETYLLGLTDRGANRALRRFGRLLAVMSSEMERFWPVRREKMPGPELRAAAQDIRFLESYLAVQGLMHLTEPELTPSQVLASQAAAEEAARANGPAQKGTGQTCVERLEGVTDTRSAPRPSGALAICLLSLTKASARHSLNWP